MGVPPIYNGVPNAFCVASTASFPRDNRFLGWADIGLTEHGEKEARKAAHTLAEFDVHVDEVFCSYLKRSIKSAWLLADEMNQVHNMM